MLPLLLLGLGLARAQEPPPAEEPPPLLEAPALVDFVQAPYPAEAEAQRIEGTVILLIEIDETGAVTGVEVLEGAGHGFDEAAVEAARQFRFSPAVDETGPVPVAIEFAYGFELEAEPEPAPEEPPPESLPVNLEGTLVEMGTRATLAGSDVVIVLPDGETRVSTTDAEGRYQFRGVPLGPVTVRFVAPDYLKKEEQVEVTAGEVTDLKLWVKNLSYRDNEIVGVYQKKREPEITRRTLSVEEIRRVPGTFGDPVRVIQNLPGAARGPFGTGLLIIRGANPEDSNVYVDGVEVPLIYHLGGYRSVINAALIESVDYLPGGYGVRYGQSTGGVIDVRTSDAYPERPKLTWRTDVLDSGFFYTQRVGKKQDVGLAASARRSYVDAFIPLFTAGTGFVASPRWFDYQLKVGDADDDDTGKWSVFVFGFQDKLFVSTPDDFAQGTDPDTQGDLSARYSTHRLVTSCEQQLGGGWSFFAQPALGYDAIAAGLGSSIELVQSFTTIDTRGELRWKADDSFGLTMGLDSVVTRYQIDFSLPFLPTEASFDPLAEREPYSDTISGWFYTPDLFVDARWRPFDGTDKLLLNPGLRLSTLKIGDSNFIADVDPRLALRWQITETTALKGGTGLYLQPPQGQEFGVNEDQLTVTFERGWSSELGLEQRIAETGQVDITGFYKKLDRLIVDNLEYEDPETDPLFVNEGIGRIYGMEFMARKSLVDSWFGWVSYTLSKSERNAYPTRSVEAGNEWVRFDFDQTHILTAVGGYQLPRDFEISTRFQYVTGNPYTPFAGGVFDTDAQEYTLYPSADTNSERLPAYLALDLRVDKLFTFKRWQLELYADFLNVVRGENPEQVDYNYDGTEQRYITGLPFIPSLGFQADVTF
jgi:TonB family protein